MKARKMRHKRKSLHPQKQRFKQQDVDRKRMRRKCPSCYGQGKMYGGSACLECRGSGKVGPVYVAGRPIV